MAVLAQHPPVIPRPGSEGAALLRVEAVAAAASLLHADAATFMSFWVDMVAMPLKSRDLIWKQQAKTETPVVWLIQLHAP